MDVQVSSCWVLLFLHSTVSLSSGANYYLDNDRQCTSSAYGPTQDLEYMSDTAHISAWTSSYNRTPVDSYYCSMSISAYKTNQLKYKFSSSSDFIRSGGAVLNIYKGLNTYGKLLATYTSGSDLPTSYQLTDHWFITIELRNYQSSTNFDFGLIVENYYKSNIDFTKLAIGVSVGVISLLTAIVPLVFFVKRRRRRNLERNVVVGIQTVTYTQPSYGNPATSNYPPPPGYPGPPPPGSTGYPQAPPPAGSTGYAQAPPLLTDDS